MSFQNLLMAIKANTIISKNSQVRHLEEMGVVERRPRWSSSCSSGGREHPAGDMPRWGVSGRGVEARELRPLSCLYPEGGSMLTVCSNDLRMKYSCFTVCRRRSDGAKVVKTFQEIE
jgi:hypothetical protein